MVSGLILTPQKGLAREALALALQDFPGLSLGGDVGGSVVASLATEPGADAGELFRRLRDEPSLLTVDVAFVSFEDEVGNEAGRDSDGR